jgi:kumamolisin
LCIGRIDAIASGRQPVVAHYHRADVKLGHQGRNRMATSKKRVTVQGSEKRPLRNAKVIGRVDPDKRIEITVILRPRSADARAAARAKAAGDQPPGQRTYLTREQFAAACGADPADVAKVEAFAQAHNLTVVEASLAKRTLRLAGTVKDLCAAFQPTLRRARVGTRVVRERTGGTSVPKELAQIVVAVLGFDTRPVARPHHRMLQGARTRGATASPASRRAPRNAADGSFTPLQVARLYDFPAGLDGGGQCIAIIELNDFDQDLKPTGTGFSSADLKRYFASLKLPAPHVTAVAVASDGSAGANVPGPDPNADGEVMLDIEVAGAVAPKAKIAVYFALNTDNGFIAAVNTALHDTVRRPSVISISWGSPEDLNTAQSLDAFNQILQDAATLGVTVCCAAGDAGSSDTSDPRARDGKPHVDFPASSPFSLACGGTRLLGADATIRSEVVWNESGGATGGGVSNFFARPAYQGKAKVPKSPQGKTGRGVPDVAGDAAPSTGYQVLLVGGTRAVIGGTSAVAPLWAGLVARFNQKLAGAGKPVAGFLNPLLYGLAAGSGALRDIVSGDNDLEGLGKYRARAGWDACTGLGTPDGAKLLAALTATSA